MKTEAFVKFIYKNAKYSVLRIKYSLCEVLNREDLSSLLHDSETSVLFITHDLGGGTSLYKENFFAEHASSNYIELRFVSYKKDLCLVLKDRKSGKEKVIKPDLLPKIFTVRFREIIVNSLVSFYKVIPLLHLLEEYKSRNPVTRISYNVHDFHCVCPHYNLVADGWFCNLACKEHHCVFDSFLDRFSAPISVWRNAWNEFFSVVDEIRCFSESSKQILLKAYPSLHADQISVKGHAMPDCRYTPIHKTDENTVPCIGIIGAVCSIAKGELVAKRLVRELSQDVKVSVIGVRKNTWDGKFGKNVRFTGAYARGELQTILVREGVTLAVFPSVCPETFSYLVSELIQMELPVVCFDLGAQGEKVRAYAKGKVCKDIDEMIQVVKGQCNSVCLPR